MKKTIAIVGMGEMGAGVAARLIENGAEVITVLSGRSAASVARAQRADVRVVPTDAEMIEQAEAFLSILPPAKAAELADRIRPVIQTAKPSVVYVDCNAVAPETVTAMAAKFSTLGLPFVDAGIIGPPPKPGTSVTRFYASGGDLTGFLELNSYGLDVRALGSAPGEASALKMSYAGITKGFQALATSMVLGANEHHVTEAFLNELRTSQPGLLKWIVSELPRMVPKAHRWVGEMEEISLFLNSERGSSEMFAGAAKLYEAVAADNELGSDSPRIKALDQFFAQEKGDV
ncbi:NAD(P)-dependent oxidoreductase [Ottowia thiooxydans]|uniref:Dehydrogenase n=1 Tax=Ottowia thiooxydans TaxID=219182 RepID=A0ABV2Q8A0_9BURK